jgi:hypothetical protein
MSISDIPPDRSERPWSRLAPLKKFTNVCVSVGCETKANTHVLNVEVSDLSGWLFGFEFLEVR